MVLNIEQYLLYQLINVNFWRNQQSKNAFSIRSCVLYIFVLRDITFCHGICSFFDPSNCW